MVYAHFTCKKGINQFVKIGIEPFASPSRGCLRQMCPDLARQGQVQRPCARRGTRAVNPHDASVWHPSPKIRVSTVCPEAGKEAGHVAISSLRKLSSGGTATPTAILLSSRRVSASLTTYQGSWLGPSPCAAASHGREGGARPLIDWLQMGTTRVGRRETLPSQPLRASGLRTLPQVLRASLGPFGVPVVLVRPYIPAVTHVTTDPSCHPRIRRATRRPLCASIFC
jgi:hypothetical protein